MKGPIGSLAVYGTGSMGSEKNKIIRKEIGILRILRFLTPFQVATMTKVSTGVEKSSLTKVMIQEISLKATPSLVEKKSNLNLEKEQNKSVSNENVIQVNFAKELPMVQSSSAVQTVNGAVIENYNHNVNESEIQKELELIGEEIELTADEKKLKLAGMEVKREKLIKDKIRKSLESKNKKSTSIFIMEEKQKMEKNKMKLNQTQSTVLYEKAFSQTPKKSMLNEENKSEEKEEQDLSQSHVHGILINKKQY
jgi:hypothetical protein